MIIRRDQIDAFDEAAARGFEDRMLARIAKYFPKHPKLLGDEPLRLLVALALKKAAGYDFTTERNVALYLDLMCLLGSSFDTDPQMPWAAEILADPSFETPDDRAGKLHKRGWEFAQMAAEDFKDLVEKNDSTRIIGTIKEIGRLTLDELPVPTGHQYAAQWSAKLSDTFPVRYAQIGSEAISNLMRQAVESAARNRVCNARGIALCASISLVLGAGFDHDPQLPWVSKALSGEPNDSAPRTRRLHRDAVECLRQWWDIDAGAEEN
jgi:hypothetical protein